MDTHDDHLRLRTLNQIADRELDGESLAAAVSHLESCAACREEVEFIRSLSSGIRALYAEIPSARLLEDLPAELPDGAADRSRPRRRPPRARLVGRRWIAAAAGLVALFAAGLLLSPDRAVAGASLLRFGETRAGALTLRYETIHPLAAESRLRARIRYWVPDSLRFAQTEPGFAEVELTREDEGLFEGAAELPPGTAYAMASVENDAGDRLDTNHGAFWGYLERDETGRPTLQARLYGLLATERFATFRAADVARIAASEFPDHPEFWAMLAFFEFGSVPPAQRDSLIQTHAARYDMLDAEAGSRDLGPEEMQALSLYARFLALPEREAYWRERLASEFPRHESAAQVRRSSIMRAAMSNLERIEALERDWELSPTPATAQLALALSYEFADPALTGKWLGRHAQGSVLRDFEHDVETARRLAAVPELRGLAEAWIHDRLDDASDWRGSERDLDESRRNFEASRRAGRARLHLALARLRFADGDLSEARAAVERALAGDWDPATFFEAARIHAALGEWDQAARLLAFARADPVAPIASPLPAAGAGLAVEPTEFQLQQARTAFRDRVRGTLLRETIDGSAPLGSPTGARTTLRRIAGEDLSLLVYTALPGAMPAEARDLLEAHADRLESAGGKMLFVTREPASADSENVSFQDVEHRVLPALGGFRVTQYFVLDAAGELRYRGNDMAAALRAAFALAGDSPLDQEVEAPR